MENTTIRSERALADHAGTEVQRLIGLLGLQPGTSLQTEAFLIALDEYRQNLAEAKVVFPRLADACLPRIVEKITSASTQEDIGLWNYINGYVAALESIEEFAPTSLARYMASNEDEAVVLTRSVAIRIYQSLCNKGDVLSGPECTDVQRRHQLVSNVAYTLSLLLALLAHTKADKRDESIAPHVVAQLVPRLKSWADRYYHIEPPAATFLNLFRVLRTKPFDASILDQVAKDRGSGDGPFQRNTPPTCGLSVDQTGTRTAGTINVRPRRGDTASTLRRTAARDVEMLADDLGLGSGATRLLRRPRAEALRFYRRVDGYQNESPSRCLSTLARFCAQYLPQLLDSIVQNLRLHINADRRAQEDVYADVQDRMAGVQCLFMYCRPYMEKYLFSAKSGERGQHLALCALGLFKIAVERGRWLLEQLGYSFAPFPLDARMKTIMAEHLHGLKVISGITTTVLSHVPEESRAQLLPSSILVDLRPYATDLLGWTSVFPEYRDSFGFLNAILNGRFHLVGIMNKMDEVHRLAKCGRRGCGQTAHEPQMYLCSRCGVVIYCSKRHQTEDWEDERRPHKAWCYKTPW